jgi:anaerobic selenocysteine-containing dehydrogenase
VVSRRTAVKGVVGAASLGVFLAGYWGSVEKIIRPATTLYGPDKISGAGVRYVYSSCLGCNVRCGIRVRLASYDGVEVVEKIEGKPIPPIQQIRRTRTPDAALRRTRLQNTCKTVAAGRLDAMPART